MPLVLADREHKADQERQHVANQTDDPEQLLERELDAIPVEVLHPPEPNGHDPDDDIPEPDTTPPNGDDDGTLPEPAPRST